jgi:putative tricarboxylic transport membrane protein
VISRDRAAALVLLLFGLSGLVEARRLTIGGPGHPGPGFFPFGLALALSLVALALLLRPGPPGPGPVAEGRGRRRPGKVVLALLAGAAYAGALETVGFVLTTFLFLVFLLTVVEPRRWTSSLAIAAATSAASHLVFKVGLNVQLPAGPWGF